MTLKDQLAAIGSISYFHQEEMSAAAFHVNNSLRLLIKLQEAGLPLNDPDKVIAKWKGQELEAKTVYKSYQNFMSMYFVFCKKIIGLEPMMDARQGKALNEIIAYLISQSKAKSEQGALDAWEFIFNSWEHLTPFIRNQTTLAQIKKNLQEILTQLRNGNTKQQQGRQTSASVRARANVGRT